MSDVESPQDVYARLLVRVEPPRGYPLWVPEPNNNLPEEYRCEGMRIGDVGVMREDGSFDVFFNICLPENHPLHEDYGVPPGFKQITFSRRNHSHHPSFDSPGRVIATKSIAQSRIDAGLSASSTTMLQAGAGLGFQFTSNSVEGALLVLPEGSEAHDVLSLSDFEAEAQENASRWYAFARQNLRRVISDDSIYLITGFHKTSSWSLASFRQAGGNSALTAQFTAGKVIDGNIAAAYSWEITDSMASRVGPLVGYSGGKNQTVFVRGYKIAIKDSGPLRRLLGKEGPQIKVSPVPSIRPSSKGFTSGGAENSSRNSKTAMQGSRSLPAPHDSLADMGDLEDDGDPEVSVERVPPALKIYHPSDVINHFLLQNTPDARVAITHDSQWVDAFTENERITDSEIIDYIRTRFDPVFDEVKGVVYLQCKDPHQKATGADPLESLATHAGSSSQIDYAVGDSNESNTIDTADEWRMARARAQPIEQTSGCHADMYNDRMHPPVTFIGSDYAFRTADGSNNNPHYPELGKAEMPYARCVQYRNSLPRNRLPDAGLVFDTLLRRDKFRRHPAGLSSLMFSFASLVVYSVSRTDHKNVNINMTSSYLDLAPLYGTDQVMQDKIRVKDGRGLLHPDVFAEDRLLFLSPASAVILVLFNRNHNYIARRILEINERGMWVDPSKSSIDHAKLLRQEEEIFQTARLCNCAWFAAVIFSDYFAAILGLYRRGSSWSLDPFGDIRDNCQSSEYRRGNASSVEFNCLYRWHATTSREDEEWISTMFKELFPGKSPEEITVRDFYRTEAVLGASEPGVEQWTFGNLRRQENGYFKDSDLANFLQNATSCYAAAFGACGTPIAMRLHEIAGIDDSRACGVCSLNDFRKFLGLKPYSNFYEWNPNKEVAEAAEMLYGHIDNMELYVGLQAEDTKPVTEGVGLCAGHTTSHTILSDTIALIRRDRFFTDDFNPDNMTAWGFADCQSDPNGWGFGSTLGRLFLRTLPNDYDEKSTYTWFPFVHPETMAMCLKSLGKFGDYSLERPRKRVPTTTVSSYVEVGEVLRDGVSFATESEHRSKEVIKGEGFAFSKHELMQKEFVAALAPTPESIDKIGQYFFEKSSELIEASSVSLIGTNTKSVDIVRNILKLVPVYWAASEIAGITLKDKRNQQGAYTPQELYDILGEIYQFIFLDVEPAKYMMLKQRVVGHVEELSHHIKSAFGNFDVVSSFFRSLLGKESRHNELSKRLFELGHSPEQVTNEILGLMVGMTVELSLALINVVNIFLDFEDDAKSCIQETIYVKDVSALEAFVIEALRIDPPFTGVFRVAKKDHNIGCLAVKQGERLFLDVHKASMSEEAFPNPTTFDATRRPPERYLRAGAAFELIGPDILPKLIVQVMRSVFTLKNVRRGPGQSGKLPRFVDESMTGLHYAYLDAKQLRSPWPTSMIILYDVPSSSA